uniref:Uncharacterized protein n=1 Tax=Apteryx owenii TaxID=8824 RepID=A0A8B9PHD8_APTOW
MEPRSKRERLRRKKYMGVGKRIHSGLSAEGAELACPAALFPAVLCSHHGGGGQLRSCYPKKKRHGREQRNALAKCPSALFLRGCEAGLSPPLLASNTAGSFQLPTSSCPHPAAQQHVSAWPQDLGGFSMGHLDNTQLQWESCVLVEGSLQPSQKPHGNGRMS